MAIITIPKELTKKGELVIIPRKEYEALLRIFKKKRYTKLDKELDEAIAEYKAGKFFGPFGNVEEGIKYLKRRMIKN